MSDDQQRLLSLIGQLPARLNVEQVAALLNCHEDDVPKLVAAKLLQPLGNPAPNGPKHFAACAVQAVMRDEPWLNKMTKALQNHWRQRNHARKPAESRGP